MRTKSERVHVFFFFQKIITNSIREPGTQRTAAAGTGVRDLLPARDPAGERIVRRGVERDKRRRKRPRALRFVRGFARPERAALAAHRRRTPPSPRRIQSFVQGRLRGQIDPKCSRYACFYCCLYLRKYRAKSRLSL